MKSRSSILFILIFGFTFGTSHSACPNKILDEIESSPSVIPGDCNIFNSMPDNAWLLSNIGLDRTYPDPSQQVDNPNRLRKWTDSIYHHFSLRLIGDTNTILASPPDSLMGWNTGLVWLRKTDVNAMINLNFVSRIIIGLTLPHTSAIKREREKSSTAMDMPYTTQIYDLTGRSAQDRGVPKAASNPDEVLFERTQAHTKSR